MDWNNDLSHYMAFMHEPSAAQDMGSSEPPKPNSPSLTAQNNTGAGLHVTYRLLQLQMQLHNLLSAADQTPAMDYVEQGLEVTKSFLEMLQASAGSGDDGTATAPPRRNHHQVVVVVQAESYGHMAVQQAFLCYSYVLDILDRAVGMLTTTTTTANMAGMSDATAVPPAALSLGFFSLASQSTLNVEVVLHLLFRMVRLLRDQIHLLTDQMLLSNLPPSAGAQVNDDDAAGDMDRAETGSCLPGAASSGPISATFQLVASVVTEREELLLQKLTRLATGIYS
jgi:hypothetical protein